MNLSWKIKRFKAMSTPEIVYRIALKPLEASERRRFTSKRPVYKLDALGEIAPANLSALGINFCNSDFTAGNTIQLLGPYLYEDYRTHWLASFQSKIDWPMQFAYDYAFGSDEVPGDIRINWELSRHHQFALLAKSFYATRDSRYFIELKELFEDWNDSNPFLWGPEWASPMEVSIRLINWLVAAAFLEASDDDNVYNLCDCLTRGAWTMAAYVRLHYSRYSSANNHTIVEATGVAVAALVFAEERWLQEAIDILEAEMQAQTYSDGVNKEQALHYQLFVMEAICLAMHVLRSSDRDVPPTWSECLRRMADYVVDCRVGSSSYIEFGDDDEGVVLNLAAEKPSYADYVLALCTMELAAGKRWVENPEGFETLRWLYPEAALAATRAFPLSAVRSYAHYPNGGITIARSADNRIVVGFDHGPLGMGSLCAHGHADALSIQMYVDDVQLVADPGTYIYNGNPEARNRFRSTAAHSTVCIGGRDQSERLGPFLWGRKASVTLLRADQTALSVAASHDGYAPAIHTRTVRLEDGSLRVEDAVSGDVLQRAVANFLLVNCEPIEQSAKHVLLRHASGAKVFVTCEKALIELLSAEWSPRYLVIDKAIELRVVPLSEVWATTFSIESDSE